ncbi:hypothetical protein [Rhizobium sp. G21]|uniref:hypothetical protein n=1 Tax=Rhizobium sp. G21 TaxID=2758439 RepID=UPI0016012642|nr:hypothetical protein [Rhizobium sp. G21]MBB1248188.1 hypothetical protein [Rhizobium sp. G21]
MPEPGLLPLLRYTAVVLLGCAAFAASTSAPVSALTARPDQLALQDQPSTDAPAESAGDTIKPGLPMPDGLIDKNAVRPQAADDKDDVSPPVEMILDAKLLPQQVQRMRVALVEAAASGDIERLRPLLTLGEEGTQVAVGDSPEDPIVALKSVSGDPDGREILAIILDILSTGAALVDKGTPDAQYVWPYFAEKSLDKLSPPEQVELYRIVTASDVADMKEFGGYNFYRIGITPEGKWKFFVAGD